MYDELFTNINYNFGRFSNDSVKEILTEYVNIYSDSDSQDEWFEKIKELTLKLGYTTDMKSYKENPDNYKGSVADVSNIIRVAITSKDMTPNLYDIMVIIGKERVVNRLNCCIKSLD